MNDPRQVVREDPLMGAGGTGPHGNEVQFDPLRLCVFATVSLLTWLAGPVALAGFAALGFVGYARARRAGLLRSKCKLGDTRVVLLYLGLLVAVAVAALIVPFGPWRWSW